MDLNIDDLFTDDLEFDDDNWNIDLDEPSSFNLMDFDNSNHILINGDDIPSSGNILDFQIPDFESWHGTTFGTPVEDSLVWHEQTTDFTCGIVSSEMIMKMFGLDISESELVFEATSEGLLTEDGMTMEGIQQVLDNHGIASYIGHGSLDDLANELEQGHKIIITLDSGEIWQNDSKFEDFFQEKADHAVVLTGIDLQSETPVVYLNDPGRPDGMAMAVDLETFTDAWQDSSNQYLATV
ncbi:C39 family peptidase [Candidatus Neomarinimicrobiota bacterium]